MLLLQNSVILYDSLLVTFLLIFATMFLLTAQFCCKKKKGKKKGGANQKTEPTVPTPEGGQPPATPPLPGEEKKPGEGGDKGDKKKKGGVSKKEKGKGGAAADKGKGDAPAKALVTAMAPTLSPTATMANDQMKNMFSSQTMLQLQNIPPGMIPVILPAAQPGGNPTVIMMPSKDMQSVAALTAQVAKQTAIGTSKPAVPTASKTEKKEPSLYEAIEISKRSVGGDKPSGKEKEASKRSNRDTKQGMADQGSYQTLADIDTNKMFQKK